MKIMITDKAVKGKVVACTPVLAINNAFHKYKKEDAQSVRSPQVKESPSFGRLLDCWRFHAARTMKTYRSFPDLVVSARDIELFSIRLVEFQEVNLFPARVGFFLSALINNCADSDYILHLSHLAEPVYYLGTDNTKNIHVIGSVGDRLADRMISGSIIVDGNAGRKTAYALHGGTVRVNGNVKELGRMVGGRVFIGGDLETPVAGMSGGELHVERSLPGVCALQGKVYHRGELVVDNGKAVGGGWR